MARQKAHTPEEIVAKLRQVEVLVAQGKTVADAVRAIGVTEPSLLSLADGVRRPEAGPGAAAEGAGAGERAAAEGGVGPDAREGHSEGSCFGKCMVRPSPARVELVITTAVASMYPASRE